MTPLPRVGVDIRGLQHGFKSHHGRGIGRYVADFAPEGVLHAAVVRSPHAHARFRITDAEQARAMPGVCAIFTAAETADLGPLPCMAPVGVPSGLRRSGSA